MPKVTTTPSPTPDPMTERAPGQIRMSPLQYGSLSYIAKAHKNGTLNLAEVSAMKQTQLRGFKANKLIEETKDRRGIYITERGRKELESFTTNDGFFRREAHMHFTGLLNLRLPGEIIKTEPRIDPKVKAELKRRKVIVAPTTPPVVETVREARRRTS